MGTHKFLAIISLSSNLEEPRSPIAWLSHNTCEQGSTCVTGINLNVRNHTTEEVKAATTASHVVIEHNNILFTQLF